MVKQPKALKGKPPLKGKTNQDIPTWAPFAIIIFTALLYIKALQNNFAGWDDDYYVVQNPDITNISLHGLKVIFSSFYVGIYEPITMLIYMFEYALFGLKPLPYHLVNVLFHLVNTWLVFKLAEKLSGKKITAFIVALLFAVHPMHVESVAWISELKDVVYSFFYLLSLLVYLRYMESGYKLKTCIFALVLFLASLLSKSAAVTLPVLLIAIDIYKGRKITTKSLLEKVPFFALSIIFGIVALLSQIQGGAMNDLTATYNFIDRIFIVSYTLAFYIVKLFAPFGLSAMHFYPVIHGGFLPWLYYVSLPFIILTGFLLYKLVSSRKEMIFAVFFFLITISLMLQIIPVGEAVTAERYTYIPYIGLFYFIGQWISELQTRSVKKAVTTLFFLLVILFSFLTINRISFWKDGIVLFTDVIDKNPECYYGYWVRANVKNGTGDMQGALLDYNTSIKLDSTFADSHNNRGMILDVSGNYKEAIKDYDKAVRLKPRMANAYNNRGIVYYELKDAKRAMADYSMAIRIQPGFANAYYNRGLLYEKLNDFSSACSDWKKAMGLGNIEAAAKIQQYCR